MGNEGQARAIKATKLLEVFVGLLDVADVTGDVVRGLGDGAWVQAEGLAQVNVASPATRELVAHLADTRSRLAKSDPFAGLPGAKK